MILPFPIYAGASPSTTTATSPVASPHHMHDCTTCVFLGSFSEEDTVFDLYVHLDKHPTVLARYGSDSPDYCSGTQVSYGSSDCLTEARRRAEKAGLLGYNVYEAMHYVHPDTNAHDELCQAVPFTLEYQAWLAYQQGDDARHQGLMRHLLRLQFASSVRPDASEGTCLLEIEARIHKILALLQTDSWHALATQAESLTEFLWREHVETSKAARNANTSISPVAQAA